MKHNFTEIITPQVLVYSFVGGSIFNNCCKNQVVFYVLSMVHCQFAHQEFPVIHALY